ncbi:MAG: DUF126 domain-containing protein [Actinophytocola sp.]|nr:DUF126 domain-containing protein [Actinophytocola sp.]
MNTGSFSVSQAIGEPVEAPALLCPVPFSARYDLDRTTGLISRTGHPLAGQSVANKILLTPGVQGGVAAGWALLAMRGLDVGFAGLVFGDINPVMVQGAVTAHIPIAASVDPAIFDNVNTGDIVRLDPTKRTITLVANRKPHDDEGPRIGCSGLNG